MGCLSDLADFFKGVLNFFEEAWSDAWDLIKDLGEFIWDEIGYPIVRFVFNTLGFVDETIQLVGVSTTKLITDEVADSLALGTLRAILGNYSIVDELLRTITVGPVNTSKGFLEYARNEHIYGLPTVSYDFSKFDLDLVKATIEAEIGETIVIDRAVLGYPSFFDWAQWVLYNYAMITCPNGSTWPESQGGHPVKDFRKARRRDGRLDTDGVRRYAMDWNEGPAAYWALQNPEVPSEIGNWYYDSVLHTYNIYAYGFSGAAGKWLSFPGPDPTEYYFVQYYLPADGAAYGVNAHQYHWLYKRNEGTYLLLDNNGVGATDYYNEVLPIVALRRDFYGTNDDTSPSYNSEEEEDSRQLLDKLNLDYDGLIDAIAENPDEDLVADAFVMFSTNIFTEDQAEKYVLYQLFKNFNSDVKVTKAEFLQDATAVTTNVIRVMEQYFNAVIQFDYIEASTVTTSNPVGEFDIVIDIPGNFFAVREQINATQSQEYKVKGPVIYHNVRTTIDTFKVATLRLSTDLVEQSNFSIPLTLDSLDGLSYYEKERVIFKALCVTTYSADSIILKWYETAVFADFFSIIMNIVSIFLIILSWGTATTALSALYEMAKQLLYDYVLTLLIYKVIEKYGSEGAYAIILAAIAYYALGYGGKGITTAEMLMDVVTLTIDVSIVYTGTELEQLQRDMEAFDKTRKEKEEELADAWDLLNLDGNIDLFDLSMILNTHPDETPGEYYQRTIHTGNPGVLIYDQIPNYVDNLVSLPEGDVYTASGSFVNI